VENVDAVTKAEGARAHRTKRLERNVNYGVKRSCALDSTHLEAKRETAIGVRVNFYRLLR